MAKPKKQVRKFADLTITTHPSRNPVEGLIGGRVTIRKGGRVVAGGRRKPVGWRKEPVRHGLAAKGIKTTRQDIRSGKARRMRGLDTSAGSRYAKLREMGYSDEDAQAVIYGIGREEGQPGIGVPLSRRDEEYIEAGIAQQEREFERGAEAALMIQEEKGERTRKDNVIRELGMLSEKAMGTPMNMMTGPRLAEAAHLVSMGEYSRAIGMLNEVVGLGPEEVTRRARRAIGSIKILMGLEGE